MNCTVVDLKEVPALSHVPEDQLDWLLSKSTTKELNQCDHLFKKGDPIDKLFIVIRGKLEIKIEQQGKYKTVGVINQYDLSGLLPFSRASTALGFGEAIEDSTLLVVEGVHFREMVANHFELTEALVHVMNSRIRDFTKRNVQEEKMMALGKLSAGLAHELNNPASAMVRSAKSLKSHLGAVPEKFKELMAMEVTNDQVDRINDLLFDKISNRPENNMKLMERAQKEEELEEWLEDHNVENAFELTETLLDFCFDITTIEKILDQVGPHNFPPTITWIEQMLTTEKMVDEIDESASRISTLVGSVKTYTHMDRGQEKTPEDLHKGIKSTLIMLQHKLKKKGIEVEKNFAENIPPVPMKPSEINQVWTNLIDNAIDAMDQDGKLTITTSVENKKAVIKVQDNGSGISDDIIDKIFDPFFTTKAIGEGTGMGLELVQRIIHQHQGDIKATSNNNGTIFKVQLPI
ncbi:ATP-binding protein [Gangjinia marincola]|uniref:histidine kinase n=1 Tax=Gangjinia marincola TaxID=578463 RepID=A0ABP3XUY2_9FLAO